MVDDMVDMTVFPMNRQRLRWICGRTEDIIDEASDSVCSQSSRVAVNVAVDRLSCVSFGKSTRKL